MALTAGLTRSIWARWAFITSTTVRPGLVSSFVPQIFSNRWFASGVETRW